MSAVTVRKSGSAIQIPGAVFKQLGIQPVNPGACCGHWQWSRLLHENTLASRNPATDAVLAEVTPATAEDYEAVVQAAERAWLDWRMVPAPRRGELVREIGAELRAPKEALGILVTLESGKIRQEGEGEVQEMIDIADFAVGLSRTLGGRTLPSERALHRLEEQWHPLGPIGVITAFNFPVAVWAWNAFIAAVCGDTVVWKPSSRTPLCALAVQHLCNRVMERLGHPGVFSLFITPDTTLACHMLTDKRLPLISFTGSSVVGRRVAKAVAQRHGRAILECSGNNAVIVDETADLDLAVPAIAFGAIGTAGQRCTSTRRLIVHDHLFSPLMARLMNAYEQVKIGDPLDPGVLMGPLISAQSVDAYKAALDDVHREGGYLLEGGEVLDRPGHFVTPAIAHAENHWPVVQRETFAPILYVMTFHDFDEAIALNNAVPQGLSSALFTNDLRHTEQFLSAVGSDCGIANVNVGTSGAEIGGAFGGEKETGGGREAGSDAWKAYMRRQTNTINRGRELPLAQGIRFGPSPGDRA
jgi:aldehyde dehydrogenase (NAD+)